jgi:hypothetical protein
MTREQMAAADKIVCSFKHDIGEEFSESYVFEVAQATGATERDVNVAIEYLMSEGLLYPTHVERKGRFVPGLRIL